MSNYEFNMILCHTRGASKGVGEPAINANNHPFISQDKSLCLVHNGRVDDVEYNNLKQKYAVKSNCDSEILLRILENASMIEKFDDIMPQEVTSGIKDIFSLINEGHMAVAVGKRGSNGERWLWLFRNQHRPLWVVDTRESLGQIFFISEPAIWEEAIKECNTIKGFSRSHKLIEIPDGQVWCFKTDSENFHVNSVLKYDVIKSESVPWTFDGVRYEIKQSEPSCKFITELDESERLKKVESPAVVVSSNLRLDLLDRKCDQIIDIVNNIRQYAEQLAQENSIGSLEFEELLADLESKKKELEEMSAIINR